jgi:hypothetical protein
MRTLIDLPDSQIRALADLCERVRQPRAAIIREASPNSFNATL